MKKVSQKGFTLIELLAVITIMGILLLVAIPAVSRTIENSRRDTFASVAAEYMNAVRNGVLADEIECYVGSQWTVASATPNGTYYFPICTNSSSCEDAITTTFPKGTIVTSTTDLLESGGKSSFGGADVQGYVQFVKEDVEVGGTAAAKTKVTYQIMLLDTGKHGIDQLKGSSELKRANVKTNSTVNLTNKSTVTGANPCKVS